MSRLYLVFESPETLVAAARDLKAEGVDDLDAHTPWRIEALDDALDLPPPDIRRVMLIAGIIGAFAIFALQTWSAVWDYPINAGGRPRFSWPAFGFATFEVGIFAAAISGFVMMLRGCRLPRLHDPFFISAETAGASDDRLYLSIPGEGAPDRLRLDRLRGLRKVVEVGG